MSNAFLAIKNKNIEELEEYLKLGNINIKDDDGKSLLMHSIISDFDLGFDLLIKNYIDINSVDSKGNTALVYSIIYHRIGYFKRLVREKADLNTINKRGESPLMIALNKKYDDITKILLDYDVDVTACNDNMENIYFSIVRSHNLELLDKMLKNHPSLIDSKNFTKRGLLHQAVMINDYNISEYLLDNGILPNVSDNFGETPIFFAIRNKNLDIIRLLMSRGALIEKLNNFYETPYEISQGEVKDFLDFLRVGVRYSKYAKKYPLHYAINLNDFVKVKQYSSFYNVYKKDDFGIVPIEYAKRLGYVEIYNFINNIIKSFK